jgi:hypothetical protein
VDAWQIVDVESYARVPRLGRKNRISAGQRERLWPVFTVLRASLAQSCELRSSNMDASITCVEPVNTKRPPKRAAIFSTTQRWRLRKPAVFQGFVAIECATVRKLV